MLAARSFGRIAVALLLGSLAQPASHLYAQVFKIQGGTSTLLRADGASVEFKAPNYEGDLGIGVFQGRFQLGATVRSKIAGYSVTSGDDNVPFALPTDIFDSTHYFSARGLGFSRSDKQQSIYGFVGATSTWLGTSFFQAAHSETAVGVFFWQKRLSHDLKFYSRDILSGRQTSLQALEWQPRKWLKTSVTGGVGSNQGYFATSLHAESDHLTLKLGYVSAGKEFRRVTVLSPLSSEVDRENIDIAWRPNTIVSVGAGHHNLLQPVDAKGNMEAASVNEAVVNFNVSKLYFGAGFFGSKVEARSTAGSNFYVGRRFRQRIDAAFNYFQSRPNNGGITTIASATVRENLFQRVSLLQLITRSNGQTTAALGGEFVTNRLHVRVDYQNVYLPFRPDKPFQQALAFNGVVRVAGPFEVTAASNLAPDGHVRYTIGIGTYLYRSQGMVSWSRQDTYAFPKYLVQGTVKDPAGAPVSGAALHIDGEVAYTDDDGHFMLRVRRKHLCRLIVAPDEFLSNDYFAVVDAPSTVLADLEEKAGNVDIVVKRVRRPAPLTPQPSVAATSSKGTSKK